MPGTTAFLYALVVGFGRDPLAADEMPNFYEALPGRPQQVVPSRAAAWDSSPLAERPGRADQLLA